MGRYLIGLDNGGTSIKAAVFDEWGRQLASAGERTQVLTPRPGYTERDMEDLWESNCRCVRRALERAVETAGIKLGEVVGLSVCGHGKGLYLWGRDRRPAYPGILSTDSRAWEYPLRWKTEGTEKALYPRLCQRFMACQQVSLLAWLKDHEPRVYESIDHVFSVKDYIRFRLTGEAYSEATDISGSGLMNIREARFDRDILEALGIEEIYEKLAPLRYSYEVCGRLTREAAEKTGLKEGLPVAGGMFDIDACAIASGVTTPEELCTIAGTWSINEYIAREPVVDGSIAMNSLYAMKNYYLVEESSATSGGNLEYFLEEIFPGDFIRDGEKDYERLNRLVQSVDPEKCEVYFLPFLYGSNAHPLGKGALVGLTTYHKKEHILRAVYEGVAFSHRTHIDRLLLSRKKPDSVRMAGGASRSPVWVEIFANVLNRKVEIVEAKELGALGAAMAAAVASGIYAGYEEAAAHMVTLSDTVAPTPEAAALYEEKYKKYTAVKEALDTVWDHFKV